MKPQHFLSVIGQLVRTLFLSFMLIILTGGGLLSALPAMVNSGKVISAPDDPKCTAAPAVTTLPADAITSISAVLNGTVNPNQGYTNYHFSWGTTTAYGNTTSMKYAGAGSCTVAVMATITELIPGMTYHFQLVAYNVVGTTYGNDEVFIAGEPQPPVLLVTPANRDVMASAGTTTFLVQSNAVWTAVSDQPWCTVTPSGTGNSTITAGYAVNNTQEQRQANITMTVEGLDPVVVMVTQAAPYVSIIPQNHDVSGQSGSVLFNVSSNSSWTVTDNQTWCTVTSSGTGNGSINAVYSSNNTTLPRVAEITVNVPGLPAQMVTVSQAAGGPYLSVTPLIRHVSPAAGSVFYTITSNLNWTASCNQSWCSVSSGGSGNTTFYATYEQNSSTTQAREAIITISAAGVSPVEVTLVQSFLESEFLLAIQNVMQTAPNRLEFDAYLLDVDTTSDLELASIQFGILLNSGIYSGGTLSMGLINTESDLFSYQQPTASAIDTYINGYPGLSLLKVAGKSPPGPGNGSIISPTGFGSLITHFRVTSSVPFTSNSTANLLFVSSSYSLPLYATRVAIYLDGVNTQLGVFSGVNAIVEGNPVLNGPPVLDIAPGDQVVEPVAGNVDFAVNSNTGWVAQTDVPWMTITPSGYGNGNIEVIFAENTSGEPRSAAITVMADGDQEIVILNQEGSDTRTLNLSLLIEGLYTGNGTMRQAFDSNGPHFNPGVADLVTVELHNHTDYTIVEHEVANIELSTSGNLSLNIPSTLSGSYFVTIKHRNSIETTTSIPVSFETPVVSYAFDSPSKAYGNNLISMTDGHCAILTGDVNQDGVIDIGDMTPVDNDSENFTKGYLNSDLNGDGSVDIADMTIIDNNSAAFVSREIP